MHATELRDAVVAVLDEHLLVELVGAVGADARRGVAGGLHVLEELVEEQAPQRLGRTAVAGEERALHHLGQIDQREDRAVEVREVRRRAPAAHPR